MLSMPHSALCADLSDLEVFSSGYPRAFYFRAAESQANHRNEEEWLKAFSYLSGVADEGVAIPGTEGGVFGTAVLL